MKRRNFLNRSFLGALGLGFSSTSCQANTTALKQEQGRPLVISTWKHGMAANAKAWEILSHGGKAIDAVEQGVRVVEDDPTNQSVGLGGLPDREGIVTLDACIMDETGNCGSVSFLQHIKNPISVARKVMDETPHVMLSGEGALQFALSTGFKKENLLTTDAKKAWEEWKKEAQYKPIINVENHDTIGLIALDSHGNLSGACTTSGLAYKMHGRVGDSPIIGAGLFVDNEVGAATATGMGEAVLKSLGSFLVVELMRQGKSPYEACKEAVMRIVNRQSYKDFQIGYIAINKKGEYGSFCIQPWFNYAVRNENVNKMIDSEAYIKE